MVSLSSGIRAARVQYHDAEVGELLRADCGERAQPHQLLTVAGDDDDAALGLRQRQPEADQ